MEDQPINEDSKVLHEEYIELTAEQEAELLKEEFTEFAGDIKKVLHLIPEENKSTKEKLDKLCHSLTDLDKSDIVILFDAMEEVHKTIVDSQKEE